MEIIVPVLVCVSLIWLIGRRVPWDAKLMTVAVTLAVVALIVWLDRSGNWPDAFRR